MSERTRSGKRKAEFLDENDKMGKRKEAEKTVAIASKQSNKEKETRKSKIK